MVKSKAVFLVVLTALLWSSGGFLVKFIDWSGISIAGWRSLIAAIFICLCLRRLPRLHKNKAAWFCSFCCCMLMIFFVTATKLTTAANAILLQYVSPVYVAIIAPFFLKEPTRRRDWIFIVIAICGMVMFFMDSLNAEGLEGNLLAVASGICFAFFCMSIRMVPAGLSADVIVWGNLMAFAVCLPFSDFANLPSLQGGLTLVAMGCLQLGLSYYLFSQASPHLTALELIVIPIIEPVLNPIIVAVLIHEIPGKWSIIGGIIVLCTISVWSIIKTKETPPPAQEEG